MNRTPLHESVAGWLRTAHLDADDKAKLEAILEDYANEDTAVAAILDRIRDEDVPMNVAADIDQIAWQQGWIDKELTYRLAPGTDGAWTPGIDFASVEDATAVIKPWMNVRVVRRVTVESPVYIP